MIIYLFPPIDTVEPVLHQRTPVRSMEYSQHNQMLRPWCRAVATIGVTRVCSCKAKAKSSSDPIVSYGRTEAPTEVISCICSATNSLERALLVKPLLHSACTLSETLTPFRYPRSPTNRKDNLQSKYPAITSVHVVYQPMTTRLQKKLYITISETVNECQRTTNPHLITRLLRSQEIPQSLCVFAVFLASTCIFWMSRC